jgi:tetratricopeptide (TPR) repeat protein
MEEAARDYRAVLAAVPDDFESWNNLGNVLAADNALDEAILAFRRAISLKPDFLPMVMNLSEVLAKAERNEERRFMLREAVRVSPDEPALQTELGLAESSVRDFEAAERAYREAIRLDPRNTSAFLELGLVLENLNRIDDLAALVDQAEANGLAGPEMGFIKAWSLRRQRRLDEALPLAEATPASINPVRRAQLLAELYDRLDRPEPAFAKFVEMNREALAAKATPPGSSYRTGVTADAAVITPERVANWTRVEVATEPRAPIFIVGFPRSGTTLLDTLLMNISHLHVLEEVPVLAHVEAMLGDKARLAELTSEQANALRQRYFEALQQLSPPPDSADTIVDKHPLHMTAIPLIHRIFPDAKVILVERHPCDAVLSCFMANFQLNAAMRSFTDLEEAARTYDAVFDAWTRAVALLPIDVHRVRYERMVEDLEGEMRALLAFLGLPWDPGVMDNQRSASQRSHIRTASYSQVTEPIYRRSAGRWQRYRAQLEPILPILAPWAERMGYEI